MGNPTLVVGVGGTGNRVLAAVERRVGAPAGRGFGLLLIDARTEPEVTLDHARFVPVPEAVNLGAAYDRHRREVARWWPEPLRPSGRITYRDGCGMVRAYGRFFAVYLAPLVMRAITSGLEELARNVPPEQATDTLDCFLVGSLTNGTGAGALHEVALLLRRHARSDRRFARVQIVGIHLDAAAIGGAQAALAGGLPDKRRTANALAAMLELQHAYEVRSRGGVPYDTRLRGADGGWFDLACEPGTSPFDYTFLFQGTTRDGRPQDREEAIDRVAEALAIWLEGADRSDRALDVFVAVDGPERFGGMGAARLLLPDAEIADRVELDLLERMVDWMVSPSPEGAAELLRRADPTLADLEPDLPGAVKHLVGTVLRIQEAPGREVNQLFDRFEDEDTELQEELEDLHEQIDRAEKPEFVPGLLNQVDQFLDTLERLQETRVAEADELVDRTLLPTLERWLSALLGAGALGLALAALGQLHEEILYNAQDVRRNEALDADPARRPREDAWERERRQVEEEAGGLLARLFFRRRAQAPLEAIKSATYDQLRWWLAHAGVSAVERVYDRLARWCEAREEILELLRDRMLGQETRGRLEAERRKVDLALAEVPSEAGTTRVVGGRAYAERLLQELVEQPELTPRALASGAGTTFLDQLQALLSERSDPRRWAAANETAAWLEREHALRTALREKVATACRDRVRRRCSLDDALFAQADIDLRIWHERVLGEGDRRSREEGDRHLAERYGRNVVDRLHGLDWRGDDPGSRERARKLLVAAVVRATAAVATTGWRPREGVDLAEQTFAVVHPDNVGVLAVLQGMDDVIVGRERSAPLNEVHILRLELGASIDDLDISPFHDRAYRDHVGNRQFEPHVDRRYGRDWPLADRWDLGRGRRAAALLALAERLGMVRHERGGVYEVAVDLPHPEGGPSLVAEKVLGRGRSKVVEWLASREAEQVVEVLRHHVALSLEPGNGEVKSSAERLELLGALLIELDRKATRAAEELRPAYVQARDGVAEIRQCLDEQGRFPAWW